MYDTLCSMSITTTTPAAMGGKVRAAREAKGWSLDEATFQLRSRFPNLRTSRGKLVRFEQGRINRDRLDIGLVLALCALYELSLSELDPSLAAEADGLREVLNRGIPCFPDRPPRGPHLLPTAA